MMDAYRIYCFDLDGTIYHGTEPVEEAVLLIEQLQKEGFEPYYITNNSSATQEEVEEKLASFGIKAKRSHIMTSAVATAQYCKRNYAGKSVQLIGETGLHKAFEEMGLHIVDQSADLVVMGIDRYISYEKLASACLAVRAGARLIATNGDKAIPTEKGLLPGAGSLVRLVEYSTGVAARFIGKPEPYLLDLVQKTSGCKKEEMILIGDNYDTDILAGIRYGIATAHVEGGVTSKEEVLMKEVQPTYFLGNLAYATFQQALRKG